MTLNPDEMECAAGEDPSHFDEGCLTCNLRRAKPYTTKVWAVVSKADDPLGTEFFDFDTAEAYACNVEDCVIVERTFTLTDQKVVWVY